MKKILYNLAVLIKNIRGCFHKHPFFVSLLIATLYLLFLQFPFITSGDSWAESWYEYIHEAFVNGSKGFFHLGIAGYFNLLPKLLSFPFVILDMPLQYVDYFFRYATTVFVVGCTSFVAHQYNRTIIKSDALRVILALGLLLCFNHITSFSMINAWYVGFIPIVLISISPTKFKTQLGMIIYASFALLVSLTKPSIILLPLVLYRAQRHKEYLLAFVITLGIILQTLLLLTSSYLSSFPQITTGIVSRIANTLLYPGLLALKSFDLAPSSIICIILACVLIVIVAYLASKKVGILAVGAILLAIAGASYSSLYAPDQPAPSVTQHYMSLFNDDSKLQREIVIRLLLLLIAFIGLGVFYEQKKNYRFLGVGILAVSACLTLLLYRPIDVTSASLVTNLAPFRKEMRQRTVDCIPIAPNVLWDANKEMNYAFPWYFEQHAYATCGRTNYGKLFSTSSFTTRVSELQPITIDLEKPYSLTAFSLPIRLSSKDSVATLTLTDRVSGAQFIAKVEKRQFDAMANPVFNLANADKSLHHEFLLSSSNPDVFVGHFDDNTPITFTYYSLLR